MVYNKGDIVKQIVTLATIGGVRTTMQQIDNLLVEVGAVPDSDMRIVKRRQAAEDAEEERLAGKSIKTGTAGRSRNVDSEDDDWD